MERRGFARCLNAKARPFCVLSPNNVTAPRIALLDDPQLLLLRPAAPVASVNNLEPSDLETVSSDIHTDRQLHHPFAGKAAAVGRVPSSVRPKRPIGVSYSQVASSQFASDVISVSM